MRLLSAPLHQKIVPSGPMLQSSYGAAFCCRGARVNRLVRWQMRKRRKRMSVWSNWLLQRCRGAVGGYSRTTERLKIGCRRASMIGNGSYLRWLWLMVECGSQTLCGLFLSVYISRRCCCGAGHKARQISQGGLFSPPLEYSYWYEVLGKLATPYGVHSTSRRRVL